MHVFCPLNFAARAQYKIDEANLYDRWKFK